MTRLRTVVIRWGIRLAVLAVLAILLVRVGAEPFLQGLRGVTGVAVVAALVLTAAATVLSAWRWTLVSAALGTRLPLRTAFSSYYRSQLLNSLLPGGVTGDVERGLRSGAGSGRRLRGVRVVAWDRAAAQAAQLVLLAVVLLASAGPLRVVGGLLALLLTALVGGWLLLRSRVPQAPTGRAGRAAAAVRDDLARITERPATLVAVAGASVLVTLLHASVFVLAASITGASLDAARLLPLALVGADRDDDPGGPRRARPARGDGRTAVRASRCRRLPRRRRGDRLRRPGDDRGAARGDPARPVLAARPVSGTASKAAP